jgi:hypothetical protein
MKQVIEYAARFPQSLNPNDPRWGTEWETRKRDNREDAESLVQFVNNRAKAAGFPARAYVVERVVMIGEWEPVGANEPCVTRGGIEE